MESDIYDIIKYWNTQIEKVKGHKPFFLAVPVIFNILTTLFFTILFYMNRLLFVEIYFILYD